MGAAVHERIVLRALGRWMGVNETVGQRYREEQTGG
jgi:hypothetical protein